MAHALLGCHIGDWNVIVGGAFGKSLGNLSSARKKPPSLRGSFNGASAMS